MDTQGTITATLTWIGAGPPPPTTSILENSCAEGAGGTAGGVAGSATVYDGLGDPNRSPDPHSYWSIGKHVVQVDSSSGTITVSVSLGATGDTPAAAAGQVQAMSFAYCTFAVSIYQGSLYGHSTVDSANWDPTHPRFFSGTNCSAIGTAVAASGYVMQATLSIGSTTVKSYYDTSVPGPYPAGAATGTNQSSVPLSVFFDSTHFADSASIPIQMTITDSSGSTYTVLISANAYNKGYDGGGSGNGNNSQTMDGAQTASFVQGQYLSANIAPTLGPSDSRTTTLNIIPMLCDFFTYAHGIDDTSGSGRVWFGATDNIVDNFGHDYTIYGSQQNDPNRRIGVKDTVANKTLNQPAYNFVFLDTCNSAFESDLANGFGISTLTASDNDCAFLGWQTLVEDSLQNADWTDYVYQQLQNGRTIQQSVDDANAYYKAAPLHQSTNPLSGLAQYQIYGDSGMTLHDTVHGGQQHHWFM